MGNCVSGGLPTVLKHIKIPSKCYSACCHATIKIEQQQQQQQQQSDGGKKWWRRNRQSTA